MSMLTWLSLVISAYFMTLAVAHAWARDSAPGPQLEAGDRQATAAREPDR